MKRRAVVTGASGYIGSHLVKTLVAEKWEVYVILRESSSTAELATVVKAENIFRHDGKIDSLVAFFDSLEPVEVVFHLASCFIAEHHVQHIQQLIESNITFGTMLLEAMTTTDKCHALINTSTVEQHFNGEEYNPMCLYAATKEAFGKIIAYYAQTRALKCISLELFDTYGLKDSRRKVINLLYHSWKTGEHLDMTAGEQQMDLVYIDDIVQAYLIAAEQVQQVKVPEKYMVATLAPHSLKDIVETIEKIVGEKLNVHLGKRPYRFREMMQPWQGGKLLPQWQPTVDLADGLSKVFSQGEILYEK